MTAPAAIEVHITGFRTVKTRGAYQIELEIPQESFREFNNNFDINGKATLVNVIPEMLTISEAAQPSALKQAFIDSVALEEKPKGGKLAQRAGIMCCEPAFWKYLGYNPAKEGASELAAKYVRQYCSVQSRAELDHNEHAAAAFQNLSDDYYNWRNPVNA